MTRLRRIRSWLRENGKDTFWYYDFISGLAAVGLTIGVALSRRTVLRLGPDVLLVESLLGVALLAVVLTALSILVAFLGEDYVRVLKRTPLGIEGALRPYKIVACISGATSVFSVGSAIVWDAVIQGVQVVLLGIATGFAAWAVLATLQLVLTTAKHGEWRSQIPDIRDELRRGQEERRRRGA